MTSPMRVIRLHIVAVGLLTISTELVSAAGAADPVNFEGTWKIAVRQSTFKPSEGSIPFTAVGAERYRKNQELRAQGKYEDFDYASARCASPGTTRLALTPEPFRVWQRNGLIVFQYQWNHLLRHIDTGALLSQFRAISGPTDATNDPFAGATLPIAKGHWDGKDLVAVSSGFNDYTLIDAVVPHGYELKVTERIGLKNANTLEIHLTIEDPEFFTEPWQTVVSYKRQPNAPFREDVCLERLAAHGPVPL